jgi:hypothetical protein
MHIRPCRIGSPGRPAKEALKGHADAQGGQQVDRLQSEIRV